MNVYLILVQHPIRGWIRVGQVYRAKATAQSWRKFVKEAWHGFPVRVKQERIPLIDGKTTDKVRARFSELYEVDIN